MHYYSFIYDNGAEHFVNTAELDEREMKLVDGIMNNHVNDGESVPLSTYVTETIFARATDAELDEYITVAENERRQRKVVSELNAEFESILDKAKANGVTLSLKFPGSIVMYDCTGVRLEYSFVTDEEKMHDFRILTKKEFLKSYSYLTEDDYDITKFYVDRALEYAEKHGIIVYHLEEGKMIFYTSFPMERMTYKATVDLNQLTETREPLDRYYDAYVDLVEGKYAANYMA